MKHCPYHGANWRPDVCRECADQGPGPIKLTDEDRGILEITVNEIGKVVVVDTTGSLELRRRDPFWD